LIVFSISGSGLAQQQEGVTASDLQPQVGGSSLQQNQQSQQTSPVTDNAGASTIQNAPDQELSVEGQPQPVPEDTNSSTRWLVLFVIFFGLLVFPTALYVYDLNKKGKLQDSPHLKKDIKPAITKDLKKEDQQETPESETTTIATDKEPEQVVVSTAPEPKPKTKKKKSKKSNKVKRGKKKK
ncbi:MAG: hypothetical protein MUF85_00515, partial [Patescibacteria group bacterium]|nr:hypothetical protein [Patescibacteria group bacterium]